MTNDEEVVANLAAVRARIAGAGGGGRLVAVAKAQPDTKVDAALGAGQRLFGENYVQEAKARWPARRVDFPDVEVHLIGPLQTNKARDAVELFDVVQTLDRERLASALAKAERALGRRRRYLVQVNTGEEPQKGGVAPRDALAFAARVREGHGLDVVGLMAIPPADEPPGPHFALLAKLTAEAGLAWCSMGMSADYEDAVRLGATHVRVGTGIFGQRRRRDVAASPSASGGGQSAGC